MKKKGKKRLRVPKSQKNNAPTEQMNELEFSQDRPEPLNEGCFSSVRREHADEYWMIEEKEQRIFRAAGFPQ